MIMSDAMMARLWMLAALISIWLGRDTLALVNGLAGITYAVLSLRSRRP